MEVNAHRIEISVCSNFLLGPGTCGEKEKDLLLSGEAESALHITGCLVRHADQVCAFHLVSSHFVRALIMLMTVLMFWDGSGSGAVLWAFYCSGEDARSWMLLLSNLAFLLLCASTWEISSAGDVATGGDYPLGSLWPCPCHVFHLSSLCSTFSILGVFLCKPFLEVCAPGHEQISGNPLFMGHLNNPSPRDFHKPFEGEKKQP